VLLPLQQVAWSFQTAHSHNFATAQLQQDTHNPTPPEPPLLKPVAYRPYTVPVITCHTSVLQAQHHAMSVQVSVYGRSRLSQDVFLGEVLIPLREVEEAGATGVAEVHKYILGRRSTKERVSGEIALSCSWRVTPLDVVIMKVGLFTLPSSTAVGAGTHHLVVPCAWITVQ